jgi:ABC-type multidrug transport system ATPase subunit
MTAQPLEVPMIEARGLVKHYRSTLAVNSLSFDARPGTVTGFLGPNGAGKSTTKRQAGFSLNSAAGDQRRRRQRGGGDVAG